LEGTKIGDALTTSIAVSYRGTPEIMTMLYQAHGLQRLKTCMKEIYNKSTMLYANKAAPFLTWGLYDLMIAYAFAGQNYTEAIDVSKVEKPVNFLLAYASSKIVVAADGVVLKPSPEPEPTER